MSEKTEKITIEKFKELIKDIKYPVLELKYGPTAISRFYFVGLNAQGESILISGESGTSWKLNDGEHMLADLWQVGEYLDYTISTDTQISNSYPVTGSVRRLLADKRECFIIEIKQQKHLFMFDNFMVFPYHNQSFEDTKLTVHISAEKRWSKTNS